MDYQKDKAWKPTEDDIQVGGFTITQQELYKHAEKLRESLEKQPESWYATDKINKNNIVYLCERSPYKHGYINPLFEELDTILISYSDLSLHGTDDDAILLTPTDYVIKNWRDETDTLHLTLFKENMDEGTEIKTIKQNIQFLVPNDRLVSKILDAENHYLSENI